MKAAFLETTGSPDVIRVGDLPDPVPGPGEVLVRVKAASLNPIDLYIRAGTVTMPLPRPYIPGCDLAGEVVAVGPGARRFPMGTRVWGSNQSLMGRQGTLAELAAVQEDWLYPTPAGVEDQQAAAVALVGITAHLGLFRGAHLKAGEWVYVPGGTGGVGAMVLQMTRAVGAQVLTSVGSPQKADLCRTWGADAVLNYRTDDLPAGIKAATQGKGINVWYETQREPDFDRIVELMAPRGRIVLMAGRQARPVFPVGPFYVKGLTLTGFAMFNASPDEQRTAAGDINTWLAQGKLRVAVGKVFPLAQAAIAHQFLEDNTLRGAGTLTGKVVITL